MKLSLFHPVIQSIVVSKIVSFSKWVANSVHEYSCVMTRLVPSGVARYIPVLVFMFCPILYAERSPNNEYLLMYVALAIPVNVHGHVVNEMLGNHNSDHVRFVILDQIYLLVSKDPHVLSVVHE